jgi:hypothetical protein
MNNEPLVKLEYEAPSIPSELASYQKGDPLDPKAIKGLFRFQVGAPTDVPESFIDQLRICSVGAFAYLYVYVKVGGSGSWSRLQF